MSVLSWRFLSSSVFLFKSLLSCFKRLAPKYKLTILFAHLLALAACVSTPPARSIFKTPGLSDAQWSNIQEECWYEAEKATASADPRTAATYTKRQLFNMCAKLKGATFVGRVTMPQDQWERIAALCKEEAGKSVAGQQASRARDERQEDLEIECAKHNGAIFQQSLYP